MTTENAQPKLDTDEALRGLQAIRNKHHLVAMDPKSGPVEGKAFDLGDLVSVDFCTQWIAYQQSKGRNVYFHANPVKGDARLVKGKASKVDILYGEYAQLDLDPPGEGDYSERVKVVNLNAEKLMRGDTPPTVAIHSGSGYNMLWRLDEPILDRDVYDGLNRDFNNSFDAFGTHNLDRVLKVPGTVAWSSPKKQARGYPVVCSTGLAGAVGSRTWKFSELPGFGMKPPPGLGLGSGDGEFSPIALPGDREAHRERLRGVVSGSAEIKGALTGEWPDHSDGLFAVAGACRRAGVGASDFGMIVWFSRGSCAWKHAFKSGQDAGRALGRAWGRSREPGAVEQFAGMEVPGDGGVGKSARLVEAMGTSVFSYRDALGAGAVLEQAWTVKGVVPETGYGILYGASGTGKSFLAQDLALRLVFGMPWQKRLVKKRGVVFYVCSEGGEAGARNRLVGWGLEHGVDGLAPEANDLMMFDGSFDLGRNNDGKAIAKRIKELAGDRPVAAVILDTLARNMEGDENSTEDMSRFVDACETIRREVSGVLIAVHHTGKDENLGARGSSGNRAAADFEFYVERERGVPEGTITLTKSRSGEDGLRWGFELHKVILGIDSDGDEVTTMVVREIKPRKALGLKEGLFMQALADLCPPGQPQSAHIDAIAKDASALSKADPNCSNFPPTEFRTRVKASLEKKKYITSDAFDMITPVGDTL